MNRQEEDKLDRLLSGGPGPSALEKERVLEEVLRRVERQQKPAAAWLPWLGLSTALAAGAAAVVLSLPTSPEFRARGAAGPGAVILRCLSDGAVPDAGTSCRRGDKLTFELSPPAGARYFSAAAEGPGGLLLWYFPAEDRASLEVTQPGLHAQSIVIDERHPVGRYRLHAFFTDAPRRREELRSDLENDRSAIVTEFEVTGQ